MKRAFFLLGLICLATSALALTADELVAKNLAARGGLEKIRAIQSLRFTGRVRFGGGNFSLDADYAELFQRPGALRLEVSLQGLTAVDAWDGKEAWSVKPFQGRTDAEKQSADEARQLARQADFDGPLVDSAKKGAKVEALGTEDIDGTVAHKLRVTFKDGDIQYHYLDPDYFLTIRVVTERRVRGAEQVIESDLGSYQQIAGVWFPFSIESGQKGRPRGARFTREHAEANVNADTALFAQPAHGTKASRSIISGKGPGEASAASAPAPRTQPVIDSGVISGLGARNIGSAAMSGRIAALAARNEGGKTILYVAAASGGVWKSLDGGTTFKPVFDKQPVQSIGAIAIDPSDAKTIWVGSGESWTRNSVSVGDGIYKSTDGGESWTNMGLANSERISRVVVHPKDSNTVYACVPGKLWSDSEDRGLYKTTDGGKTWSLILKGPNLSTGCSNVALDPKNPEHLYAGLWDFRRKGWTFRSGGDGPDAASGSGLFTSTDGGASFTEVSAGLPAKPWGRTAVEFAPSDPKVIYAVIESVDSALYRSGDGGATWEKRDKSQAMVWRPFYFSRLVVDPHDPLRIFKPNGPLIVSEDGGRSFNNTGGGAHGDWHDLWIDPDNTKHIIGGDDGGLWISHDGGNRWWKGNNLPVSQFYHVAVDMKDPYQVYGGLQDNSSWAGPSSRPGGVANGNWENLFGGDGFWTIPDPTDPDAVYVESQGGNIGRIDRKTMTSRDIQPKAGLHEKLRFNWNAPIHVSRVQKNTLYIGAQVLFRSRDRGDSWQRISPDLTTNDPEKQKQEQAGGITVDNSSAEMHTTIYAISESPLDGELIWVGTDDGNVQLTTDGGKNWTNLTANVPDLPKASWVSWVEAGRFDKGTAYAAFDRHTFGDMTPWVYRTTDSGKSWTRIIGPEKGVRGYAHVIKEDLVSRSLLFAGTEFGLWISLDSGATWAEFKGNGFPSVAVRDLQIHPRDHDLVLATHGRGIWIVDDITPLRSLSRDVVALDAAFIGSRPAQQRLQGVGGWPEGDASFSGESATDSAVITYYQRTRHLFGPIKLEILDESGKVIGTVPASKRRGLNRAIWPMQLPPPRAPRAAQIAFASTQGPRVLPGKYKVRLTKGSAHVDATLDIELDRRAPFNLEDRKQNFAAAMKVHGLFGEMSTLSESLEAAKAATEARLKALAANDELAGKLRAAADKLDAARKKIVATKEGGAITGEERIREHTDQLYGALIGWEGRPGSYQLERIEVLRQELDEVKAEYASIVSSDLGPLGGELQKRHLEPIPTGGAEPHAQLDQDRAVEAFRCAVSGGAECTLEERPTREAR